MRFPFYSNIAGIDHYCTENDEGRYDGYIKAEENKVHPQFRCIVLNT